MNKKSILIVEDDPHIAQLIAERLKEEPFEISRETDGEKAYDKALNKRFDVIILDIMLPNLSGTEICRMLRANGVDSIIIMLTSKSEEIDKILGLELGADDYITKPFSPRELLSRIHARLRRVHEQVTVRPTSHANDERIIHYNGLSIDVGLRKVTRNKQPVELTPKEFELLVLLSTRPGKTYTRMELLNLVWGSDFAGFEHTVNTHINRLRTKIESDPSDPFYILTTWGVGYKFRDPE